MSVQSAVSPEQRNHVHIFSDKEHLNLTHKNILCTAPKRQTGNTKQLKKKKRLKKENERQSNAMVQNKTH